LYRQSLLGRKKPVVFGFYATVLNSVLCWGGSVSCYVHSLSKGSLSFIYLLFVYLQVM